MRPGSPADRPRAGRLCQHLLDLAHLFQLGLRIVILHHDVLGPGVADDLDAVIGELPHDPRMPLAGEAVGRAAALDLQLVHQVHQAPDACLVGVLGIREREVVDLVRGLLQGHLARAHERFECHVEADTDLRTARPRPLARVMQLSLPDLRGHRQKRRRSGGMPPAPRGRAASRCG
jgi:hypothetical protein